MAKRLPRERDTERVLEEKDELLPRPVLKEDDEFVPVVEFKEEPRLKEEDLEVIDEDEIEEKRERSEAVRAVHFLDKKIEELLEPVDGRVEFIGGHVKEKYDYLNAARQFLIDKYEVR